MSIRKFLQILYYIKFSQALYTKFILLNFARENKDEAHNISMNVEHVKCTFFVLLITHNNLYKYIINPFN